MTADKLCRQRRHNLLVREGFGELYHAPQVEQGESAAEIGHQFFRQCRMISRLGNASISAIIRERFGAEDPQPNFASKCRDSVTTIFALYSASLDLGALR